MPVASNCESCGWLGEVADHFAGRRVKCPECGALMKVSPPEDARDDVADADDAKPEKKRRDDDRDDDPRRRFGKKMRTKRKKKSGAAEPATGYMAMIAGIIAVIGAVVWFIVGWVSFDRTYIYPPILFIAGIAAFMRGMWEEEQKYDR